MVRVMVRSRGRGMVGLGVGFGAGLGVEMRKADRAQKVLHARFTNALQPCSLTVGLFGWVFIEARMDGMVPAIAMAIRLASSRAAKIVTALQLLACKAR